MMIHPVQVKYFIGAIVFGGFTTWPGPLVLPAVIGIWACIGLAMQARKTRKFWKDAGRKAGMDDPTKNIPIPNSTTLMERTAAKLFLGRVSPFLYAWGFLYSTIFTLVLSLLVYFIKRMLFT